MADEHDTTGEEEGRPFAELLHQQRNGDCHHEATQKLRQLIASVQETGRPGSLSLTFTIKPSGRLARMVLITDQVGVKLPELPHDPAVFYVTKEGALSKSDPDQQDLPYRELPARRAKEVSA
jgi:hypothetical protein